MTDYEYQKENGKCLLFLHSLRALRLDASRLARPDCRTDHRGHGEERAADPSQPPRLCGDDPTAEHGADDAGHAFNRGHGAEDAAATVGWGGLRDDAGQ